MPGLQVWKEIFPEIWADTQPDPLDFFNALVNQDLIPPEERLELLQDVARMRGVFVPIDPEELRERAAPEPTLWERFRKFIRLIHDSNISFWGTIIDRGNRAVDVAWDRTLGELANWYMSAFASLFTINPADPPFIKDAMADFKKKPSIMGALWVALYRLGYVLGWAMAVLPIVSKDAVRKLNREFSPALPDISTLVSHYYKTTKDRELVYRMAAEQGFDKKEVDIHIRAFESMFSPEDLRSLFLRGVINEDELSAELGRTGWSDDRINKLKELYPIIPGPSDLVSMSVREAWRDEYAERWGSDEDRPEGLYEWGPKVGLSDYWIKRFWRAHWNIPSILQGFEMLHRNEINPDELNDLLKALDIMPGWREKLIAISYNPLTRVDVRRMYRTGTLDRAGVHRAYLDVGYNEKNAALMTDFTVKWVQGAERDLTKADVLGAYQRRLLDKGAVNKALIDLGYDKKEAALLMSRTDYDLAKKKKASVLKNLEKSYKRGVMDSGRIQGRMQELNMAGAEITELINLWDAETRDDTAALSRGDIDAMVRKKIISKDDYRAELIKLKYVEKDIDLLVKLNG